MPVGETEEQAKLRFQVKHICSLSVLPLLFLWSLSLTLTFQVEMEFVQSLANPNYLHFLAQRGFMKDPCFVNYLNYLTYWKVGNTIDHSCKF